MAEWLEYRSSDFLMFGLMGAAVLWIYFAPYLFPAPYASAFGMAGYFSIMLVGMFASEVAIQLAVNKYLYIEMILRPDNRKLHLFVAGATAKRIGKGLYAATLELAYKVKLPDYGKVKTLVLCYHGEWAKRLHFRPGRAWYAGYIVKHPQTEVVEAYQAMQSTTFIDHGRPVPVFYLHSASQDCLMPKITVPAEALYNGGGGSQLALADLKKLSELEEENAELKRNVAELRRSVSVWQQRALALEEVDVQKTAETRGLLDAKGGIKDLALEYMMTMWHAAGNIEKAIEMMRGPRVPNLMKYVTIIAVAAMAFAYLYLNPELVQEAMVWLRSPVNSAIVVLGLLVALVAMLYMRGRKR